MPVLANFHAELIHDADDPTRVEDCQVTLEDNELRFAGTDYESRIDLQSVFDVKLGQPPMSVADRFANKTLTIAVEREHAFGERGRDIYFLSDEDESSIEHFGQLLYKSVLNGTEVAVRHPVQIGGRRTNSAFTIGELHLGDRTVGFTSVEVPFKVEIDSIIDFSRDTRELLGEEREVIEVEYVKEGRSILFEAALSPDRKRFILGRYLRLEYTKRQRELSKLDLSPAETKALATLYTMNGKSKLQTLISGRSESSVKVLKLLQKRGLVSGSEGYVQLTPKGWIMIRTRFKDAAQTKQQEGPEAVDI